MSPTKSLPGVPSHWPRLIDAVERPGSILEWSGSTESWNAFLIELWANGLFPIAYRSWRESEALDQLPEAARIEAESRMTQYRAGSASSWAGIDDLLAFFCESGLHPVPLKGVHLAIRYYAETHLRPISDLDVLFTDLETADKAFDLLVERGFNYEKEGITGEPWDMCHQRTALEHPRSGFHVEVHGGLVYAPRDRRWINRADCLIDGLESYDHKGLALRGLNREANAVFLSAHTFMQHAQDPAKAVFFYDLKHLLGESESEFDWNKVCTLAKTSGFEAYVARGMAILKELDGYSVPDGVLRRLGGGRGEEGLKPDAIVARTSVQQITHAAGPWTAVKMAWSITIPSKSYLRFRYTEKKSWPVLLLYPYRWWKQAGKIAQWLFGRKSGD